MDSEKERKAKAIKLDISSLVPYAEHLQKTCATSTVDLLFKESFCQRHMCIWELQVWCQSFIVTSTTHIQVISNIRRETLLRHYGPYLTLLASKKKKKERDLNVYQSPNRLLQATGRSCHTPVSTFQLSVAPPPYQCTIRPSMRVCYDRF